MGLLKVATACLLSTALPSTTALNHALNADYAFSLFSRADGQCVSGQSPCNTAGLPSNFCCPSNQQCIAFNDNKSAICCPTDDSCNVIQPVSCDLSKQNATLTPLSQLHSTDLSGSLQQCGGSNCCPKGFSCQNGNCVMGSSTSSSAISSSSISKPSAAASSNSSPVSTTAESSSTPSSTTTPSSSAQTSGAASVSKSHQSEYPAKAVLLGFFPGMIAGALLLFAIIICLGRRKLRRQREDPKSPKSDFSSVTANVSDPIYQDTTGGLGRTDFLRRENNNRDTGSSNGGKRFSVMSRTSRSVRSLFGSRRSPTMQRHANGTYTDRSSPTAMMTDMPRTPENNRTLRREPSTESIKIYSPPNMHGLGSTDRPHAGTDASRNTTFTEMMAQVGFKSGEPYLGSPGRVDPRSRGVGNV